MNYLWIALFGCLVSTLGLIEGVPCIDEQGNSVDWWVILKVPYLPSSTNQAAASGYAYAYADSRSPSIQYTNNRLDQNVNGALGATLGQIYTAYSSNNQSEVAWLMYNDESPDGAEHDSNGHTKGVAAFDSSNGFWLVHSVPRYPAVSSGSYSFPANEKDYGQSFLCVTYSGSSFNTIGGQFLINAPFVYDSNLPPSLAKLAPNMNSVLNKQWTKASTTLSKTLSSQGGQQFTSFAKNSAWGGNLYESFVEPYYRSGMLVETWMNGADSNKMPTFCTPNYAYDSINIRMIDLTSQISWPETKDHSKWAVTTDTRGYICIGDINRQFSQSKRGGGTVCQYNQNLWASFNSLIQTHDNC